MPRPEKQLLTLEVINAMPTYNIVSLIAQNPSLLQSAVPNMYAKARCLLNNIPIHVRSTNVGANTAISQS